MIPAPPRQQGLELLPRHLIHSKLVTAHEPIRILFLYCHIEHRNRLWSGTFSKVWLYRFYYRIARKFNKLFFDIKFVSKIFAKTEKID